MAALRRALYCAPAERALIRERAAAAGMTVSRFVVACALRGEEEEPRLALSADEQRLLYDRVADLDRVRQALQEELPGTGVSLFGAIALLHGAREPGD